MSPMKIRYLYGMGEARSAEFQYLWALADAFVECPRFNEAALMRRCRGLDTGMDTCHLPWRYDPPDGTALQTLFKIARESAELNADRVWWYHVARELLQMAVEDKFPGSHLDIVITVREGYYELIFKSAADLMQFKLEAANGS